MRCRAQKRGGQGAQKGHEKAPARRLKFRPHKGVGRGQDWMQIGGIKNFIAPLCGRPIPKPGSMPVIVACVLERSFAPWTGANPSGAQQAPEIQAPKGFKSFLRGRHLVGNAFEFFARSRAGSRIWTREAGLQLPSTDVERAIRLPGIRQSGNRLGCSVAELIDFIFWNCLVRNRF